MDTLFVQTQGFPRIHFNLIELQGQQKSVDGLPLHTSPSQTKYHADVKTIYLGGMLILGQLSLLCKRLPERHGILVFEQLRD